ncbi:hypothetical protein BGAL_0146g00080 [Botrytis galanthina]|uniref:Uncharacterized protein n=1 Tax=Botrytis galanthina TaxID=278940 RepID=A0A4S8R1U3_9HELO|nr:hypothetical protein BGAL_0146g00080 [Botrytis galanthina]
MHSHFSTAFLAVLFRITLCDTFYYEGVSSVGTSTFTPITYYSPTTLVSTAYPASTETIATDYSTTPTYYTYPSYSTSASTSTEQTTYILPTSGVPTTTVPTTNVYATTTTSSSSSTCIYQARAVTAWGNVLTLPSSHQTKVSSAYNLLAPTKLLNEANQLLHTTVEEVRKLIRIYDSIEKAKPVIDKAIEDGLTECQDFKDLVAIVGLPLIEE